MCWMLLLLLRLLTRGFRAAGGIFRLREGGREGGEEEAAAVAVAADVVTAWRGKSSG